MENRTLADRNIPEFWGLYQIDRRSILQVNGPPKEIREGRRALQIRPPKVLKN